MRELTNSKSLATIIVNDEDGCRVIINDALSGRESNVDIKAFSWFVVNINDKA